MAQFAVRLRVCLLVALLVHSDATSSKQQQQQQQQEEEQQQQQRSLARQQHHSPKQQQQQNPAPAPAPGPARPIPCFRTRTKYNPLDMEGEKRTDTNSAEDCQARCAKVSGCVHFTWYENLGCHISDRESNRVRAKTTAMSGPVDCEAGNFCFRNGFKYEPNNMPGKHRTDTIDALDCQMRCANTDGCASFVWYPDGGCHIQDKNAKMIQAHSNIVSGPPNCDPTTTSTTTITGTTTSTITTTETTTSTSSTVTTTTRTTTSVTTTTKTTTSSTRTTTSSTRTLTTTITQTVTTLTSTITTSTTTSKTQTTTSTRTTTSSPHDVCLMTGKKFTMPDGSLTMSGTKRVTKSSPYLCQSKCRKTTGCVHFSWWSDGGCHLQDGTAVQAKAAANAMSGPTSCHFFAYCFENRHKWEPLMMSGQARTEEASPDDCQARCQTVDGCKHFSFWSDGGCHLQDEKATRKDADNSVTSGPRQCHYKWKCADGYMPADNNLDVVHLTPDQAKMRCINQGCKGFTYKGSDDEQGRVKVFIKARKSGGIDPDSVGQGWRTCVPEGPLTDEDDEEKPHKGGEDNGKGGKGTKGQLHEGGEDNDKGGKGTKEEPHKGGEDNSKSGRATKEKSEDSKEEDHGKGGKSQWRSSSSDDQEKSEDSKKDTKSEKADHGKGSRATSSSDQKEKSEVSQKAGKSEEEHHGKDSSSTSSSDQEENPEDSQRDGKSEKEDHGKGSGSTSSSDQKDLQRLFVVNDRPEMVVFTKASSTKLLSGIAAGCAGILMVAGAVAVFRSRRPVVVVLPVLLADEAPDDTFVE